MPIMPANEPLPHSIRHLLTDSRRLLEPQSTLFFAIRTRGGDGHRYVPELFRQGVRHFVVSDLKAMPEEVLQEAWVKVVPDPVAELQHLAQQHRKQFSLPVIGITGSNGKTIVKEWLHQLLSPSLKVVRSPRSYNSQIGVPLSVWQLREEDELAIFEAGISQPGEMEHLERIIRPTIGIFTNIGQAHQEGFRSMEEKVQEKLKFFARCETLIYCRDHEQVHEQLAKAGFSQHKTFTWGHSPRADVQILESKTSGQKTDLRYHWQGQQREVLIPFADAASVENACHCLATMLLLGITPATIAERMPELHAVEMRLELKKGINGCLLINDSYNSDLASLALALDFLNQQEQQRQKTLILSDILQSGLSPENLYSQVAELLRQKGVQRFIGIGPELVRQRELFPPEAQLCPDTATFLQQLRTGSFQKETILLKGARPFRFEAISRRLEEKQHQTRLEINLHALVHNLKTYRSLLRPDTKVMAMVKAFGYGSGSGEVASLLQFHQVDYLGVAYADEGVDLRQSGITLPIMVMNPEEAGFAAMLQQRLEPEIYSFPLLEQFAQALEEAALPREELPFPIHLKLDTGMRRLGFEEQEVDPLLERLVHLPLLKVASVFTHLAASDAPEHDEFTRQQLERFEQMSSRIRQRLGYPFLRHALNSSGIARFPQWQMELVRLGIGLYGIESSPEMQQRLQPVSALKTTISQVKEVQAGESIGYSRSAVAERPMRIATIGIGYADGLDRHLSRGHGRVFIHGKAAPIVGNICMDMCMVDVTNIPAQPGDEVEVFGPHQPVQELARQLGTIPYEVLTSIPPRVKRVYFQE